MSKSFNEKQMGDPWMWALSVLDRHKIKSKELSDFIGAPRSTIRSLMNQTNSNPKYALLIQILAVCIQLENGVNLVSTEPESVVEDTLSEPEYDWL